MSKKLLLKSISYYGTGGSCDYFFAPTSLEELQFNYKDIIKKKLPYFILGGGTNSLVSDKHWPGAVISLVQLKKLTLSGNQIEAEAGVTNTEVAELLHAKGLSGGEWMYFLPGQLGGTVRMNARCFGGEISQVVTKILALNQSGDFVEFEGDKQVFRGYKDTIFMDEKYIIAKAWLDFVPGDKNKIYEKMQENKNYRDGKGHFNYPSCGCVFKNDYKVGVPSGRLLEAAGCKKLSVGGAKVNPDHANFVYNVAGAHSEDILKLTLMMREAVYKEFGVWLEYEMEILGGLELELLEQVKENKSPQYKIDKIQKLKNI